MSDVASSPRFGLSAITVWVLPGATCEGIPTSSLFPLSPLFLHLYLSDKIESYAASFCHLATNHHLEIYPTIKSFSRNLPPRLWNARWSRSGWAVQSQSWSVCTLPPQCHLSCFWQTNAAPQETSEVRLITHKTTIITSRSSSVNK